MKNIFLGSLLLISSSIFASELPSGIKSCKFQNIYSDHKLTEIMLNDNIGSRVDECPREMIYNYSEYHSPRTQVLRLTHAVRNECWYGNVTCLKE